MAQWKLSQICEFGKQFCISSLVVNQRVNQGVNQKVSQKVNQNITQSCSAVAAASKLFFNLGFHLLLLRCLTAAA